MELGMIGLGKMGARMVQRLRRDGHRVVVWDLERERVARAADQDGVEGAEDLKDLCFKLAAPRLVWVMVPSGKATDETLDTLGGLLESGDVLVDGGNSPWKASRDHAARLAERGVRMLDAGTSGGVWGLEEGYCLMVGGDADAFAHAEPAIQSLAPDGGYARVGPAGAGHFVKMIHNGIEYALMEAYGEGFELMQSGPYAIDLAAVARLWGRGSVIRSWLLELAADALQKNPELSGIEAWVPDSGEGRWTVQQAVDSAVAAPVIAAALFARFASRKDDAFGLRLTAALRDEFGGHGTKAPKPTGSD